MGAGDAGPPPPLGGSALLVRRGANARGLPLGTGRGETGRFAITGAEGGRTAAGCPQDDVPRGRGALPSRRAPAPRDREPPAGQDG
eukprot:4862471-Alexandrium_andersonii.AAC.1